MLPTYNRARYLEMALRSVLDQDPGPEQMQIAVIDNSTTGEVREVVRQLGSSRVEFYFVAEHVSVTAAMTLCVERARGSGCTSCTMMTTSSLVFTRKWGRSLSNIRK